VLAVLTTSGRRVPGALAVLLLLAGCHQAPQPHGPAPRPTASAAARLPSGLTGRVAYNDVDGDLWVMNADGSGRRQVTHSGAGSDFDPSWSPDGTRIVFRTTRGRHLPDTATIGLDGIYVARTDGSGERPIQPPAGGLFPDWSPDGAWIAFSGVPRAGSSNDYLYVMRPDGTGVRPLNTSRPAECATWSPDGSRIAFCGHWRDDFDVGVMDADGSHVRRLTDTPGHDYPGVWSPDGKQLAFSSERDGGVWVMDADGTHRRRVAHTPGAVDSPDAWLPDRRIVFACSKPDAPSPDWYVMRSDGTGVLPLPPLRGAQEPIDWLP
jgi:Tol biopolymer transport system component